MQVVKEYVFSLMLISIGCAAINMLTPEKGNLSKYVHFIAALVVSVVMLAPIQSIFNVLPELFNEEIGFEKISGEMSEAVYSELLVSKTVDIMKQDISTELEKRFTVVPEGIDIKYDAKDPAAVEITGVTVYYKDENSYLFSDTKRYIEKLLGCECEVKQNAAE